MKIKSIKFSTHLIALKGIISQGNETNLLNEKFVKQIAKVDYILLLPNIKFSKN